MNTKQDVLAELANAKFKVDEKVIEELARLNVSSMGVLEGVRGGYLKALVAASQANTKARGRRKGAAALASVEQASEIYYAAVLRGITTPDIAEDEALPQEERTARALERNRRSNFARVAKSALVGFVKAGGDVNSLNPETVTRNELKAFSLSMSARRAPIEEIVKHAMREAERVESVIRDLADRNKDVAVETLQDAMHKLTELMTELGRSPTTKAAVSMRELRPLRLDLGPSGGVGTFFPMSEARVQ